MGGWLGGAAIGVIWGSERAWGRIGEIRRRTTVDRACGPLRDSQRGLSRLDKEERQRAHGGTRGKSRLSLRGPASVVKVDLSTVSVGELNFLKPLREATVQSAPLETASGRWVVVPIRDRGPGIPLDALERVFERFYRADPARDRDRGGSGLGLPIARALIMQQSGQIWMESPLPDWDGKGLPGAQASFALPIP